MHDILLEVLAFCRDWDGKQQKDPNEVRRLYSACIAEHVRCMEVGEKYRALRAGCYGEALNQAAGKPVSDLALERVIIGQYGVGVVEEYKNAVARADGLLGYMKFFHDLFLNP